MALAGAKDWAALKLEVAALTASGAAQTELIAKMETHIATLETSIPSRGVRDLCWLRRWVYGRIGLGGGGWRDGCHPFCVAVAAATALGVGPVQWFSRSGVSGQTPNLCFVSMRGASKCEDSSEINQHQF